MCSRTLKLFQHERSVNNLSFTERDMRDTERLRDIVDAVLMKSIGLGVGKVMASRTFWTHFAESRRCFGFASSIGRTGQTCCGSVNTSPAHLQEAESSEFARVNQRKADIIR